MYLCKGSFQEGPINAALYLTANMNWICNCVRVLAILKYLWFRTKRSYGTYRPFYEHATYEMSRWDIASFDLGLSKNLCDADMQ